MHGATIDSSQIAKELFGSEDRFKGPKVENPGPGAYADVNKWHKKTYNLKFLNVA